MRRGNSVLDQFVSSVQETVAFYRGRRQFQDLFKYIRKKAPSANTQQNVRELNSLLDVVVADFAEQLRGKKLDSLPIPEFHRDLPCKVLGRTVKVDFHGQNGTLTSMSTLGRRDNCALIIPRADSRIFTFSITLKTAVLEFERYELHCGPINAHGRISVEARDNAVCIKVAMRLKENGHIQTLDVTRAELSRCGKYRIRVTGFGSLGGNSAAKLIIKMMLNKYKNEMKYEFEKTLRAYVRQTIVKFLA